MSGEQSSFDVLKKKGLAEVWLGAITQRSGLSDEWCDHVIAAAGRPMRLKNKEAVIWRAALHGVATRYADAIVHGGERHHSADEWRRVLRAIDDLRLSLLPFEERPPVSSLDFWFLDEWARKGLDAAQRRRRPPKTVWRAATVELLLLYWHAFGVRPSGARCGSTERFVAAFFAGLEGGTVELIDRWRPELGEPAPAERPLAPPPASACRDLIRSVLKGFPPKALPFWWGNIGLKRPHFLPGDATIERP